MFHNGGMAPKQTKAEEPKVQVFVSMTRAEKLILEALAAREGRTLSGQIRFMLRPLLVKERAA